MSVSAQLWCDRSGTEVVRKVWEDNLAVQPSEKWAHSLVEVPRMLGVLEEVKRPMSDPDIDDALSAMAVMVQGLPNLSQKVTTLTTKQRTALMAMYRRSGFALSLIHDSLVRSAMAGVH